MNQNTTATPPSERATEAEQPQAPLPMTDSAHTRADDSFGDRLVGLVRRMFSDTGLVLTTLPVTIAAFAIGFTGLITGAVLLVFTIGLPVLAATLMASHWFASTERRRFRAAGYPIAGPVLARTQRLTMSWRGWWQSLTDVDGWRALAYANLTLWLSLGTFIVTITWWALGIGGVFSAVWNQFLPDNELVGISGPWRETLEWLNSTTGQTIIGVVFLLTLPWVTRAMAVLHVSWARIWLGSTRQELAEQVEVLNTRRAVAAEAEAQALRRVERDIHDGPQQRLVRLGMDLASAERKLEQDPAGARELLEQARLQTADALSELRTLSRGIAPPVLADRGLQEALNSLVARNTVPTTLTFLVSEADARPGPDVAPNGPAIAPASIENAAYFLVAESLTNIAKHSQATSASVTVRATAEGPDGVRHLVITVADDGVGGASLAKGHGLAGLADRLYGVGGTFRIESPSGGPTRIEASLPY